MGFLNRSIIVGLILCLAFPTLSSAQDEGKMNGPAINTLPVLKLCSTISDSEERLNCSNTLLIEFIKNNLKYPAEAKAAGIEGKVMVKFTVDIDGKAKDVEVTRDIGYGCGEEVVRLFNSMPEWTPGLQEGKAVPVSLQLPVQFQMGTEPEMMEFGSLKDFFCKEFERESVKLTNIKSILDSDFSKNGVCGESTKLIALKIERIDSERNIYPANSYGDITQEMKDILFAMVAGDTLILDYTIRSLEGTKEVMKMLFVK